jgi:hypothetical protein
VARRPSPQRTLALALVATALLLPGLAAGGEGQTNVSFRNRLSVGAWTDVAQTTGDASLKLVVAERMRWVAFDGPLTTVTVLVDGRFGFQLLHRDPIDGVRVRALGARVRVGGLTIDAGRFRVRHGGHRLVDGVQLVGDFGKGFELGFWSGAAPDPWTTAPAARFGGGPVVAWTHRMAQVHLVGELLGGPATQGLDRASALLTARVEPLPWLEARGRLDLQYGGRFQPVSLADGALLVDLTPLPTLDLGLFYDAYSSQAYLGSEQRNPRVSRFESRAVAQGLLDDPTIPQDGDKLDPTVSHLFGLSARWRARPEQPAAAPWVGGDVRYRHHAFEQRRYARGTLRGGVRGIRSRLDLSAEATVLWWGGAVRGEAAILAWLEPDKGRWLALDASLRLGLEQSEDGRTVPSLYADLFVDLDLPAGLLLSAGYRFTSDLDLDRWNAAHAAMLRLSWRVRLPRPGRSGSAP